MSRHIPRIFIYSAPPVIFRVDMKSETVLYTSQRESIIGADETQVVQFEMRFSVNFSLSQKFSQELDGLCEALTKVEVNGEEDITKVWRSRHLVYFSFKLSSLPQSLIPECFILPDGPTGI